MNKICFHKYKIINCYQKYANEVHDKEILFVLECNVCKKRKVVSKLLLSGSAERFARRYNYELDMNKIQLIGVDRWNLITKEY